MSLYKEGYDFVIGVDEAGRGPLCGPVVAGACVFMSSDTDLLSEVTDSKQIEESERERIFEIIEKKMKYGIGQVDNNRIDEINILQATFEAMTSAVDACINKLTCNSSSRVHVLIDGPKVPPQLAKRFACTAVVRGDAREFIIGAASIVAKVLRDRLMLEIHRKYPTYNLIKNKGYPTAEHMHLVRLHGPCEFHRMTFAPIKHMTPQTSQKSNSQATLPEQGLVVNSQGLRRSTRLRGRE